MVRPRKFGKSLLIEQLKLISMGNRHIFGPLEDEHGTVYNPQKFAVYDDEELFNRGNATLHLDFSALGAGNMSISFLKQLHNSFLLNGIKPPPEFPSRSNWENRDIATDLITTVEGLAFEASSRVNLKEPGTRRVDILIDEYDTKITAPLAAMKMRTHKEMQDAVDRAVDMRTQFQNILGPLKALSPLIGLLFITGVNRFPQTNLFSSLNDLSDVTFDSQYSTLFGYTRAELEVIVRKDIDPQFWEDLTKQYNGYCWGPTTDCTLFNPYDLNRFLNTGEWDNYWVMQGTSSRISAYLKMCHSLHKVLPLDLIGNPPNVSIAQTDITDLDRYIPTTPQAAKDGLLSRLVTFGYMTRDPSKSHGSTLTGLKVPNAFVRAELEKASRELVSDIVVDQPQTTEIHEALKSQDLERFTQAIKHWIHSTPYKIIPKDQFTESIFHFGFHSIFATVQRTDMEFTCEHMNRFGRSDIVVKFRGGPQYVIELKTGQSAEKALKQVVARDYKENSLLDPKREIIAIGIRVNKGGHVSVEHEEISEAQEFSPPII